MYAIRGLGRGFIGIRWIFGQRLVVMGSEQVRWCALSTMDGDRIDLNELFQGFSIITVFLRSSLNIPCSIELETKS